MKVSFEGIGETVVTFYNDTSSPAAVGDPVKISGNGEVSACADGDKFCGICIFADDEYAAVQMKGYIKLAYSGETAPAVGFSTLAADGNGGISADSTGAVHLVIDVDTTNGIVGIML